MSEQPAVDPAESVVAEAPPVAVPAKKPAASLQLLGGDEIIQLSIRPSPWCIALYAFKPVLAVVLLAAAVVLAAGQWSLPAAPATLVILALLACSGIVVATLHWASQLYVLTNRRVLRFRGLFAVDVVECGLSQIGEVRLHSDWYEPLLRLGSIYMMPTAAGKPPMVWEHVARPAEVHEILARAIQKSKFGS